MSQHLAQQQETALAHSDIDVNGLLQLLPHRAPMLMVEKLTKIIPSQSATGYKSVSMNEPFFQGHFPGHPIMPGVLIVEALAQTAGALVVHSIGGAGQNKLVYFMGIEEAKFRKPVLPGDYLALEVEKVQQRRNVWKFRGTALVDGEKRAEAVFTAMIQE